MTSPIHVEKSGTIRYPRIRGTKVIIHFDRSQVQLPGGFKTPAPHLIKELTPTEVAFVGFDG